MDLRRRPRDDGDAIDLWITCGLDVERAWMDAASDFEAGLADVYRLASDMEPPAPR